MFRDICILPVVLYMLGGVVEVWLDDVVFGWISIGTLVPSVGGIENYQAGTYICMKLKNYKKNYT